MIETALQKGVAPRAEIAHPGEARKYLDLGVKHFCIGTDVRILFDWFKANGAEMKKLLGLIFNRWTLAVVLFLAMATTVWIVGPLVAVAGRSPLHISRIG